MERPKPLTAQAIARRFFRHENAVLIVVLVALIAGMGVITKGLTTKPVNMMNILLQSSMRGYAAVGQAFVILTTGIDLSVGGLGLLCSILGALLMTKASYNIVGHPMDVYTVIPIMIFFGVSVGTLNGLAVSRIGMPPLIVTLAMWQICNGVAFQLCGGKSIAEQPSNLTFFGQGHVAGVAVPVIIFIAIAVMAYFVLNYTAFGRSVYAVGGNPVSAWLSGINVKNTQLIVYSVSGCLAGLAGVVMTGRIMSASMRTLEGLELDSIAAVCIGGVSLMGGRGSLIGVIIGVLIIGVINNAMSVLGASPAVVGIVKGAIIFTAVAIDYLRRRG